MSSNRPLKRSRATAEQLQQLTDSLMQNPGLAGGKFQKLHGKLEYEKKWAELFIVSLGGAVKSVDQWQSVWRDSKCRTSTKIRDRKQQQAQTGNKPLTCNAISELEKSVVAIIGNDYIEGHDTVLENVPENEEFQLRLEEEGDISVLEIPSTPVCSEIATPKTLAEKTPQRGLKRKRLEEYNEVQRKFLEIAQLQADSLKMLAESNASYIATTPIMAKAIQTMGQGLIA